MAYSTPWQELHRWADDGGIAEHPTNKVAIRRANQRYWIRKKGHLNAIRRESGRNDGYSNRRLEIPR